ncbi:jerky protein-like [Aphis craccivora]|uniref:Jerky protein-like n=1 Tax=Aphis craccivora TaxID=307492 RepID=A0A6G0Y3J5_APHCR|nr:jerky protein-like [Aphis craccivora]
MKKLLVMFFRNIYNYDETNLTDNPGQKKVIVKRGSKYPERICNTSKVSISLMMCGNAAGQLLPPYVVYKAKGLWQPWTEGGPTGCRYNASPSGWFDASLFCNWFDKSFPKLLKKLLDVLKLNMESTLKNGFRKCGIFPCNADELLARLPQAINVSSSVEESFIEHLNNKRYETTQTKKQIRKKLKIAPDVGQNLVVEDDLDIFCPVSENGKYSINDFVIFKYDETLYPGRIISTTENGAFIQSMEKYKKYYRWSVKTDEMFYSWIYTMSRGEVTDRRHMKLFNCTFNQHKQLNQTYVSKCQDYLICHLVTLLICIHFVNGFCNGNARAVVQEYRLRYPERPVLGYRSFIAIHRHLAEFGLVRNRNEQGVMLDVELEEEVLDIILLGIRLQVSVAYLQGWTIIGPYVLPNRLNQDTFLEFLREILPVLLEDVPLATRQVMWFQLDGAPAHFARSKVYAVVIESREQLLDRIDIAAKEIRKNHAEIQRTTQSVSFRAQACLQSGGEHFENLIN